MFDRGLTPNTCSGTMVRMSRTPVRRRRALTVLAVLMCLLGTGPVSRGLAPRHEAGEPRRVYVVQAGDSLWSIAVGLVEGEDPRVLVDAIARRNRIDAGAIVPGQALVIPVMG
jgi:hypothetical protein